MMHLSSSRLRTCALAFAMLLPARLHAMQDSSKVDPASLKPPPPAVALSVLRSGVDSVTASPGDDYSAWFLHRFVFGDLNRDLWKIQFRVPVLRLDTIAGGLTVAEVSGGKQTLGLRLMGKDSIVYQFRSMVKDPRRAMPKAVHWTPFATGAKDQMAGQFPLAPMVVAELLEVVGVLVSKPRPVVMPDDERLGEYREAFAGRMGWIELRPEEGQGDRPGFAGSSKITDTYSLYDELQENPDNYVNVQAFLRARMIDFIVGDWDRHSDQWRWARFKDDKLMRWDPIPRDRDWAFPALDGLIRPVIGAYYPQYTNFSDRYPKIIHLAWASQRVDRTILAGVKRDEFIDIAREVANKLTDKALMDALAVLPPTYKTAGAALLQPMQKRRDGLQQAAKAFYELLAREADVHGTLEADSATITSDGVSVRLQLHEAQGARAGRLRYDRTFLADETKEVRLYLLDGEDRVVINGTDELPLTFRIVTGKDDDTIADHTRGDNVRVYNSGGDDRAELGAKGFITDNDYLMQDSIRTALLQFNKRDWGSGWLLTPSLDLQPDIGLLLGGKLARYGYGFGQQPCHSCLSLEVLGSVKNQEWIATLDYDKMIAPGGWWLTNTVGLQTGRPTRFYGFGNEVPGSSNEDLFTGFRQVLDVRSGFKYEPAATWNVVTDIGFRSSGAIRAAGEIFEEIPYGGGDFEQLGLKTALEIDSRDNRALPRRGIAAKLSADFHPSWLDVESPFGSVRGSLRWFGSVKTIFEPALHLRLVGEKVWGTAPFGDIPALGGSSTLPGFSRAQFRGDAMASGSALLRAKALSVGKFDVGAHALASVGRVWADDEDSSIWHRSSGAGMWLHVPKIGKTLSVTFARGGRSRTYIDLGFIF